MVLVVMPGGRNSEISYRVKCVVVESERVFGDFVVTKQTRDRLYWVTASNYPNLSKGNLCNLTKQVLEAPDFMTLNRKQHRFNEARAISPSADSHEKVEVKQKSYPLPMLRESVSQEVVVTSLVDQLLLDIYGYPRSERGRSESDSTASSYKPPPQHRYHRRTRLLRKSKRRKEELGVVLETLEEHVNHAGGLLIRQLRRRDYLKAKRDKQYDVITAHLQAYSAKRSEDTRMRFSLTPQPGESGFTQWLDAMKMVARLQGGIPQEFRKRLWLTLAERHLDQRGVDWKQAEKLCFNEWSNPDDEELGIQIVKDLHRTGCSLFCGAAGRDNQAVLRRVLLGFARWNKSVGYCQGLNVLAALVLQVTDRAESSAVKVMIYLIEGVLPEGYFADNLRGLSIDMAVFRDLLRMRLPKLSRHLETLQSDAKDKTTGSSYEPPLTNVFTMQWFLTLFCHCLPQEAVLRVWDLIFLEGDEVLLRTALAIWEGISDRIMTVTSADEFYSIMGVLTREMLEFTDVNHLIKTIVNMGPLHGVTDLREKHRYNITPWGRRLSEEEDTDTEEEERLAVAAAMFGVPGRFKKDRSNASSSALQTIGPASDRERLALDISTLKHQYAKLRERQRQAHIILSAACARQSIGPSSTSQAMNHLLVGKSALVSAKTRQLGPPPGAIPPKPRTTPALHPTRIQTSRKDKQGVTLHWKDTKKPKDEQTVGDETDSSSRVSNTPEMMPSTVTFPNRASSNDSDSDSTSTELCDEPDRLSDVDSEEPTSTSDCYIMATDDEKSPRPGSSPNPGDTPVRQSSEQHSTGKRASLDVQSYGNDVKIDSRQLLNVDEASSSIAKITDQIRRLSASDDNNSSPIGLEIPRETKNKVEVDVDRGGDKSTPIDTTCSEVQATVEIHFSSSPENVQTEIAQAPSHRTEEDFQLLDRYDFLSSSKKLDIAERSVDSAVPLVDKYHGTVVEEGSIAGSDSAASSVVTIASLGTNKITEMSQSALVESIARKNVEEDILRFEGCSLREENCEKDKLVIASPEVPNSTKYRDPPGVILSPIGDPSETIAGERTSYSRSYVIGHLPISPATVNEKLSRATESSHVKDDIRILSTDFGVVDADVRKGIDSNFGSVTNIGIESEPKAASGLFADLMPSNSNLVNSSCEILESANPIPTSAAPMTVDDRVPDTSVLFDDIKKISYNVGLEDYNVGSEIIASLVPDPKILNPVDPDISLTGNATNFINKVGGLDYDLARRIDRITTGSSISTLIDKKEGSSNVEKVPADLSLNVTGPSKLSSNYVYHDYLSKKKIDDKKKSPKTPDSGKSFSSGETMGPDSKGSSLTSPRSPTNRSDSRNYPLDKSERSSLSSESKTLTLRSLESDIVSTNGKTKLEKKTDATRPSLEKSSPSTPISTDSLKNKSEISPKFVISSSSESCSPCKANKSSERSFSSDLQSPISANSIKYRTNFTEGQENLSETSIASATSPFYPIVNPNQKTPSPYSTVAKQTMNGHSAGTSPEQKSTTSKEETNSSKYTVETGSLRVTRSNEVTKSARDKDEYDSARPFEKELAETLLALPCERTKNERLTSLYKEDVDLGSYRSKKTTITEEEEEERYMEIDTVSPLPRDKYEPNRLAFVDKNGSFKGVGTNERDLKYSLMPREPFKPFERSCSSLEKRFTDLKASPSTDELTDSTHKKRSSDILEDIKHLEANVSTDGKADTSMMTRKTGYAWEDLQNLEARRQDNFSDSASKLSRVRTDPPCIKVLSEARTSYVVEPKINLEECSDSILKSYSRNKSNGEPDDDRESKLGVWTKVKPRAGRDNGRRSSDRALKIIQENSAILHKILTCQAKKRLPDLEEITKEITISPINEEISKIFSPILEKMGLNEHEINEELARINFKDFDQMTTTSGSEFDAKINDELSKLSLIDDNEIVDQIDVEDVISRDYLDTREALIDRQINEELSKLLANYEESSPICISGNRDGASSSCQNPSEIEALDISSISTNVFSYQSSNESIEAKSELESIQDTTIHGGEQFPQYRDDTMIKFAKTPKYSLHGMSPRSDIDIYRELEKLDKISSGEIMPSSSSSVVSQKIISPISYTTECSVYTGVRPSSLEYCAKMEKPFERSPMKSPYDTYKPYDFKSRISPRKTPSNPYSARSYDKSGMDKSFDFHENPTSPSRLYDLGISRPALSKETLEFRVRYDDETSKVMRNDDLSLQPYQTSLVDLDRGASYYSNEASVSLARLETERTLDQTIVPPLDCTYNPSDVYTRKYEPMSPKNYSYGKSLTTNYENNEPYKLDEKDHDSDSYLSLRRKNSHSLSPKYQCDGREFGSTINPYNSELAQCLEEASKRPHPEFADSFDQVVKYGNDASREALNFRKAALSLGPLDNATSRLPTGVDHTPSPRSLFNPFPIKNTSRKPKELGLKLGLYSPSSPGSTPLKRP